MYECLKCGAQSTGWQGRCQECGAWGSLGESNNNAKDSAQGKPKVNAAAGEVVDFDSVEIKDIARIETGIGEFDRTMGGGIVPGSLTLLGGEPGIGKSTLILDVAQKVNMDVLYASGEESAAQIKLRMNRLGIDSGKIKYLGETETNAICATIEKLKPGFVVIDSIQTIYCLDANGEAGSVTQVRACAVKLLEVAKKRNIAMFIIGHITKGGEVAGPKTLEHLVDTVLYLEGDRYHSYRILRGIKNRFGSTGEAGIFEMKAEGLMEVTNPSEIFLSLREKGVSGSVATVIMEGSRPFLVEVQALTSKTHFGYPKRSTSGYDLSRMQLILSVLTKRIGLNLETQDVHVNIAGGLKVTEPAIDLAVALAVVSSFKNKPIGVDVIALGEIGLGGEIRKITHLQKRKSEAEKLGFKNLIEPEQVKTLNEAIEVAL